MCDEQKLLIFLAFFFQTLRPSTHSITVSQLKKATNDNSCMQLDKL